MSRSKYFFILLITIILSACVQKTASTQTPPNKETANQPNTATGQSACAQAGGTQSIIRECDGTQSDWCQLSATDQCYADQVENNVCPINVSPRVLCGQAETSTTEQTGNRNQTKAKNNHSNSPCLQAGGFESNIKECDGSESPWCILSETDQCYADQISGGKCPDMVSPRVLCDQEQ